MGVHLAAAAIMMLLGFMRPSRARIILLVIGIALIAVRSRGSMLAIGIPIIIAIICSGRWRQGSVIVVTAVGLLGLAYMLDLSVPTTQTWDEPRNFSAKQLVENFSSIFTTERQGSRRDKELAPRMVEHDLQLYIQWPLLLDGQGFWDQSSRSR